MAISTFETLPSAANRRCRRQKWWTMGPYADKNRCACPADLNPCMRYSRWRVGRWEFSPVVEVTTLPVFDPGQDLALGRPPTGLSGVSHARDHLKPLSSLRKNFFAARLLRRLCTRMSSVVVLIHRATSHGASR